MRLNSDYLLDAEDTAISKVAFNGSGFPLSWVAHANASCGYVVDWYNTSCTQDCNVEWTRVAADNTNTMVQSGESGKITFLFFQVYII